MARRKSISQASPRRNEMIPKLRVDIYSSTGWQDDSLFLLSQDYFDVT